MKSKARKALSEAVDLILWEEWDPIGVNDNAAARDEYRSYVRSVLQLLTDGAAAFKLAKHLESLEHASMGCGTSPEQRNRVAEALLHAYNES